MHAIKTSFKIELQEIYFGFSVWIGVGIFQRVVIANKPFRLKTVSKCKMVTLSEILAKHIPLNHCKLKGQVYVDNG